MMPPTPDPPVTPTLAARLSDDVLLRAMVAFQNQPRHGSHAEQEAAAYAAMRAVLVAALTPEPPVQRRPSLQEDSNAYCRQHGGDGLIDTCVLCRPKSAPPPVPSLEERLCSCPECGADHLVNTTTPEPPAEKASALGDGVTDAELNRHVAQLEALMRNPPGKVGAPHDPVNAPKHYTSHPSGVECIEVVEHMHFNIGNVIKYCWRAGLKHLVDAQELEDLKKARWYLNREIERQEAACASAAQK